jgi:hypothetical protein
MNSHKISILLAVTVVIAGLSWHVVSLSAGETSEIARAHPLSGAAQHNDAAAVAAFEAMVPVLRHPRCMNCHSSGDFPRQGDDSHPHAMNVRRGPEGEGVTAQKCSTCHQNHNLAGPHLPPGAPDWHLPSRNMPMIWQGLSDNQLCELFKDPNRNGHRNVDQIVEHMRTPLVVWGWHPGEGRTPIPTSQSEFEAKVKEWVENGAACPGAARAVEPNQSVQTARR